MPSNAASYRRHRPRPGQARQEPGDAVVVALAAQVVVCIILLLLAVLAKKANEARYSEVRSQYDIMVSDPAQNETALDYFEEGGGLQQIFGAIERAIQSLLSRITGAEPPQPSLEEPAPETGQAEPEPVVPEPEQEQESSMPDEPTVEGEVQPEEEVEPAFDYYYLETAEIDLDSPLGQGGLNPVDVDLGSGQLPVPEGNSMAPVALAGNLQPPVTGLITSDFAYRFHPVTGDTDFHNGMDIAAEEGRDVLAALPGRVVETGWSDIYGNYVMIEHSDNLSTYYAHCSEIIVAQGTVVRGGERIAKVGETGVATGPHLHFSVIVEGKFTDPYWVLKDNITLVE